MFPDRLKVQCTYRYKLGCYAGVFRLAKRLLGKRAQGLRKTAQTLTLAAFAFNVKATTFILRANLLSAKFSSE